MQKKHERCRRMNSFVSETVRVMAGLGGFYFANPNNQVRLSVDPSHKSKFRVHLYAEGNESPLCTDTRAPWQRVVCYVREACLQAKNKKAAIRVFGRILPGGPTKEMRRLVRQHNESGEPEVSPKRRKKRKDSVHETPSAQPTGISDDELVRFNPILAEAFAQFATKNNSWTVDVLQAFVAAAVKTGAAPEKIYATIKTGRIVTDDNMQFLTESDIEEWQLAVEEYQRLATNVV